MITDNIIEFKKKDSLSDSEKFEEEVFDSQEEYDAYINPRINTILQIISNEMKSWTLQESLDALATSYVNTAIYFMKRMSSEQLQNFMGFTGNRITYMFDRIEDCYKSLTQEKESNTKIVMPDIKVIPIDWPEGIELQKARIINNKLYFVKTNNELIETNIIIED